MAERIQRQRTKGWRMPAGAVNVTRPCDWSNPFRVDFALDVGPALGIVTITPGLAVALFRAWVCENGWEDQIRNELAGRDLVCWCRPDEPCHADVLLELANPPAPPGFRWARREDPDWQVAAPGMICRRAHCEELAVAELLRPDKRVGARWWAYCGAHMYGRWVEHGRVWYWRMVPDVD